MIKYIDRDALICMKNVDFI